MAVDVMAALKDLLNDIFGSPKIAQQFAEDPYGTLAAQGISDADGLDVQQVVGQCAADSPLGEGAKQALQSYSSGSPAPASYPVHPPAHTPQTITELVQQIQYVTHVAYEDNDTITNNIVDNSVEVHGDNYGDITQDNDTVSATGDGAVAAGDDANVAQGDGSQVIDGDNFGTAQANSGAGAVQAGDDVSGVNTGINTGTIAGDDAVVGDDNQVLDIDGDVGQGTVFGDNSGLAGGVNVNSGGGAGGDASGTGGSGGFGGAGGSASGDGPFGTGGAGGSAAGGAGTGGNASGGQGGDVDLDINFGSGSETTVENSTLDDSAVGSGGDTSNVSEDTDVVAVDSNVATEQGPGDQAVTLPPPPEEPAEPVREPLHEEPIL